MIPGWSRRRYPSVRRHQPAARQMAPGFRVLSERLVRPVTPSARRQEVRHTAWVPDVLAEHPRIGSFHQPPAFISRYELSPPAASDREKQGHIGGREPVFCRAEEVESFGCVSTGSGGGGSHDLSKWIAPRHAFAFDLSGIVIGRLKDRFSQSRWRLAGSRGERCAAAKVQGVDQY